MTISYRCYVGLITEMQLPKEYKCDIYDNATGRAVMIERQPNILNYFKTSSGLTARY